jgi:hypothetical protein
MRNKFWLENNSNGKLRSDEFFKGLQKIMTGITEEQFGAYVKKIYNYQGELTNFKVDEFEFKSNHYPFYLYEHDKNEDTVIRLFAPMSKHQLQQFYNMTTRINKIVDPSANVFFSN